jgi:hypothetical protein
MPLSFTHQGVDFGTPDAATSPYVSDLPYPYDAIPVEEIEAALEARIAAAPLDEAARAAAREHAQSILGRFLADGWNRGRVEDDFAIVAKWADRHGIARERIVMGEFGVTRRSERLVGAAQVHRRRWMSDVTHVAASHGFGWSIWDLNSYQMGIYRDGNEDQLDQELVSALAMSD